MSVPCKFFNAPTGCRNGSNCTFLHDQSAKPVCRFYGTEIGCKFGDSCMYAHSDNNGNAPRGRGRGRGGQGRRRPGRGRGMGYDPMPRDQPWYGEDSEDVAPAMPPRYKPESRLNDMLSHGLKPTPEGWEEYSAVQKAFREADREMMEEQMQPSYSGGYRGVHSDSPGHYVPRGRAGRARGRY